MGFKIKRKNVWNSANDSSWGITDWTTINLVKLQWFQYYHIYRFGDQNRLSFLNLIKFYIFETFSL